MKSNVKKIWIGILILAIACLAIMACVIGVKASNVVDENILNLEENADTVVEIMTETISIPRLERSPVVFDGEVYRPDPSWFSNFDSRLVIINADFQNAAKHKIGVRLPNPKTLDENTRLEYRWSDGSNKVLECEWEILPRPIDIRELEENANNVRLIYTGNSLRPELHINTPIGDIGHMIQLTGGATYGIEAQEYYSIVTITSNNFVWLQTNNREGEIVWRILPQPVGYPYSDLTEFTYNGKEQTLELHDFNPNTMSVTGNLGTNVGDYTAEIRFTSPNYCWNNLSASNYTIKWYIAPKPVAVPTLVAGQNFIYNGSEQIVSINGFDGATMNMSGNTGTNAGSYCVTLNLKDRRNYSWVDTSTGAIIVGEIRLDWSIAPKAIVKPSITASLTYNGSEQSVAFNNLDLATMNVSGNTGTNAGSYTATLSLQSTTNYKWADNTTANFTLNWSIARKSVAQPTALANNVFVYTSSNFTYIPNGFDAYQMDIQGNVQSAVGKYTASVTPNSNHMWSNGTTTAVTFDFEIIPAGITLRQNVYVDYIYNDNGTRKSYGVTYRHKLNDSELNIVNGETRYILGNIKAGTSIGDFLQSLLTDSNLLVIKDIKGNVLYDGLNNIIDLNKLVSTGYEVILYKDNTGAEILDRVYLSVLGDLTGDGQINSADMAMLNRILSHELDITSYSLELQLATMLNNNGMLSSIDKEIMHNIVKDIDNTENYFGDKELTSDYVIFELNGNTRVNKTLTASSLVQGAVVGNISQGTTANEFVSKMQAQGINISLSDMHRANNASLSENDIVGTGCYFTYNGNMVYLTILGDLTGDGRVNSQDRLVINKVVSGSKNFDDMITAVKLACLINNNGAVTSTDSEIIWQSIIGAVDLNKYIA